tara:strand:- start:344 stop:982 length:639 start_codon:yes stop_codon:yes gene_type:complete
MALVKLNNRGVKDITAVGSIGTGDLVFLAKQSITSPVSSVNFVHGSGGVDFTSYKEYIFYFVNLHPNSNSEPDIKVNFSTDGGSNYNVTKTSTGFYARHAENDDFASIAYEAAWGLAQSTGNQLVGHNMEGADADASLCGSLQLFNPSSTTFVKHYIGTVSYMHDYPAAWNQFFAGYCNTTSAIDAVSFIGEYSEGTSGNIDSGDILLYGVN